MIARMYDSNTLFRLVCRPALPKDTREVMELTRTIWEGEDYVPQVWLEWLSDPLGLLAIAEFGGQVVGLGKLSQLSPVDWWLEGLRVHPKHEGQGIASHLHNYLLRFWLKHGNGTIRLVTASFRIPIHRICEHAGFQRLVELTPFLAPMIEFDSREQKAIQFDAVNINQIGQVSSFVAASPIHSWTAGLMDLGWQWAAPSLENIRQAVICEQVYWWRNQRGVIVISEDDERPLRTTMIRMIACRKEDVVELLQDYRRFAGQLGFLQAGWIAPLQPEIESKLKQAGFQRDWDASLYLFEKKHRNS